MSKDGQDRRSMLEFVELRSRVKPTNKAKVETQSRRNPLTQIIY